MSMPEKMEMLRVAMGSESSIRKTLAALDLPKSTYYRWRHKWRQMGLKVLASPRARFTVS